MRMAYNRTADVLSFILRDSSATTRELGDGIVTRYDAGGQLAGIQVSDALKRIGDLSALQHVVSQGLGPPVAQGQPPSTVVASHIVQDERGVAWIDDTNIKVIEVVMDRIAWEWSPEAIHRQHPQLSLAQIHAALSYYYDHQAECNAEIERQDKEVEAMWTAQGNDTPVQRRLRAAGRLS
jgi:uncharacterized protein (DUF433 family)/uncharacterized protein YuzE